MSGGRGSSLWAEVEGPAKAAGAGGFFCGYAGSRAGCRCCVGHYSTTRCVTAVLGANAASRHDDHLRTTRRMAFACQQVGGRGCFVGFARPSGCGGAAPVVVMGDTRRRRRGSSPPTPVVALAAPVGRVAIQCLRRGSREWRAVRVVNRTFVFFSGPTRLALRSWRVGGSVVLCGWACALVFLH